MGDDSFWEPNTPVRPQADPSNSPPTTSRSTTSRSTTSPPTTPPSTGSPPTTPPGSSSWTGFRRALAVAALLLVVVALAGTTAVYVLSERLGDNVDRVQNAFAGLDEVERPPLTEALTFLLVGMDSRADTAGSGRAGRGVGPDADVVMLAHVAPDRKSATVVSIPRDSAVDIPGHGRDRVGGAYTAGGPSLLIRTVERLTNLRVDHFAVVDFAGFRTMVDAVGGIDVDVVVPLGAFPQGLDHMNGAQALAYVRDRSGLDNGEHTRRQQAALRAILGKAASTEVATDPVTFFAFLDAATRTVGVDDTLSNGALRVLALQLIDLRPANVAFVRVPVVAVDHDALGVLLRLDPERSSALWAAVRQRTVDRYLEENGHDALGPVTR